MITFNTSNEFQSVYEVGKNIQNWKKCQVGDCVDGLSR